MRRLILLVPVVLAACATTAGNDGGILIETLSNGQPVAGASCTVRTGAGTWDIMTPATIAVGNAVGDLHVLCNKPGYRNAETIYRPSRPVGSNVGLGVGGGGGNVGVGVGLNFPIALGGAYPARISVELSPQ